MGDLRDLEQAERTVEMYKTAYDELRARHLRLLRTVREALVDAGCLPQPPEVG